MTAAPNRLARAFAGLAALLLCTSAASADTQSPRAVATIAMIGDVAANVAGDCVRVDTLMGPGVDPHLYQAKASDVRAFEQADTIFYAGYSLEGQLGEVLGKFGERKPTVAVAPSSIDTAELITVQDIYGIDPHLWMDVGLWSRIAPTLAEALAEIAPDCADAMQQRASDYREQLAALDAWIGESIATIPERQRVLVTAHDAFAYYGRAYGIEVEGIQGISTESEAGIADIRRMVATVVERGVPAVFIESTINPRTIEAVVDGAADRGHEVAIGGELFSDAMGEPGTAEGTYIGMLRSNTITIVEALGGEPAPWPDALSGWAQRWDTGENGGE
ncbi:zinc ABC transporter substrate-binding protein [Aquisalimonas lutea]|uniref:metal ABC transporter solute-binding protein, Zn/Mn family n=1 Tax=Aquisalimonas lutea TaxID=1327750 RepID=UPI0025B4ED60|nr:zinc ABC transporter substrate-binding protein [Aquisalimonas lutea]MDN3519482.1 zinc ABC transporter substrate-binding protein [Aquisalimonas lutea]